MIKIKKKSLTAFIFVSTLLIGSVVYLLCTGMFVREVYKYFEDRIFTEMETEAVFLKEAIKAAGIDFLKEIDTQNRITLVNEDGTVLFDNRVPDDALKTLGNHNSRDEIIEAKTKGKSRISRYSDTMLEKTLYVASKTKNNYILRISCKQQSMGAIIIDHYKLLLTLFILAIGVTILLAYLISKKLCESINKIDLDNPENSDVFMELKPFTKRISEENFEKNQRELLRQQFTANVSHELKTPLTSISGFAEILKEGVPKGDVDKKTITDFSETIYDESQRMINLVNDIIKLSKLDEQSITDTKEELSLREISKEVIELLQSSAVKKNIRLLLTGDSGVINGVQSVIYEMIYNLCDNAIKYNKEGGTVFINIKTDNDPHHVTITVKDTGIGIEEGEKERIFERFYRIDKSRSREMGGTGLGLSIVKHGAKYHNATVEVESEKGNGTTFTVVF